MRNNRGTDGAKEVGFGERRGVSFFHFLANNGAFWFILVTCFNVSMKHVKVKQSVLVPWWGEETVRVYEHRSIFPTSPQ